MNGLNRIATKGPLQVLNRPGDDDPLLIEASQRCEAFTTGFGRKFTGAERVVRRALGAARDRVVSLHENVAGLEARLAAAQAELAEAREDLDACIRLVPDQPSTI